MATTNLTEDHFTFKNGDIKILVTLSGKQAVGMVSSHALALASPVWMKFAFLPPFCKPPNVPTRTSRQVRCMGFFSSLYIEASTYTISKNYNANFSPGKPEQSTAAS
jgi:hypothetical protein